MWKVSRRRLVPNSAFSKDLTTASFLDGPLDICCEESAACFWPTVTYRTSYNLGLSLLTTGSPFCAVGL